MKVIGKQITAIICPECGVLLRVEKKDITEKYEYGYIRTYIKCCNCKTTISADKNRVYGIYELDNPSDYVQINR